MKALQILSIIIFTVIFGACSNSKNASTSTDTTAVAANPATAGSTINNAFSGKKWKLTELAGIPVADSINGKMPFISFNLADSTYEANGGCNGMGGKFTVDTAAMRIRFKQGMSTMMACPDIKVEEGLKQVFTTADNYTIRDGVLSLNKARMAPLARFRAVE